MKRKERGCGKEGGHEEGKEEWKGIEGEQGRERGVARGGEQEIGKGKWQRGEEPREGPRTLHPLTCSP